MINQKNRKPAAAGALLTVFIIILTLFPLHVFAGDNIPVTVNISVTYSVDGNAAKAGGDKFTLTADDPRAPMPEGTAGGKRTITIRDEGKYSFGDLRFMRPEVFWYTITREMSEKKGVIKDDSIYRAKVIALNDGHGYVLVYRNGSSEKNELAYMDRVTPATGDNSRIMAYVGLATASAAALTVFAAAARRKRKKEVQNETRENI